MKHMMQLVKIWLMNMMNCGYDGLVLWYDMVKTATKIKLAVCGLRAQRSQNLLCTEKEYGRQLIKIAI